MLFYLVAGVIARIVVSLLSEPVADKKLKLYCDLIHTPVTATEPLSPCTLLKGVEPADRHYLFAPVAGIQIVKPSKLTATGFLLCGVAVVALIAFMKWLVT